MMRKALLLILVILCFASLAFAQWGYIYISSDASGTSYNFNDAGTVFVYFWHMSCPGATGCEFQMDLSRIVGWTFLAQNFGAFLTAGYPDIGISINYGSCLTGNICLGSSFYTASGQTPKCSWIIITKHPRPSMADATTPLALDCEDPPGFLEIPCGVRGIVNNPNYYCDLPPVEKISWGCIKALYK